MAAEALESFESCCSQVELDRAPRAGPSLAVTFDDADLLREYVPDSRCELLVITFGSLTLGYGGIPTHSEAQFEFVGACRRLQVTHALHVRDRLQSWYLRQMAADSEDDSEGSGGKGGGEGGEGGVGGGDRSYDALIALLVHEVAKLRPSRVVTIGSSMGGYAAVRVALTLSTALEPGALPSTTAVAFGAQVFLRPAERTELQLPWQVFDPPLERLRRSCETHSRHVRMASLVALLGATVASREPLRVSPPTMASPKAAASQAAASQAAASTSASISASISASAAALAAVAIKAAVSAAAASTIAIELHCGRKAPGDMLEAYLLQAAAIGSSESTEMPAGELCQPVPSSSALDGSHAEGDDAREASGPAEPHGAWAARGASAVGVRVHVHEGCGHNLAASLRSSGALDALLRELKIGSIAPTADVLPPPSATFEERLAGVRRANAAAVSHRST